MLEDSDALIITNYLVDNFPSTCKDFRNSLSSKVLYRLAEFIFLLPYDAKDVEMPAHASQYFSKVQAGVRTLDVLTTLLFNVDENTAEDEDEDVFFSSNIKKKKKNMTRKQRRYKEPRKRVSFDANDLNVFDEDAPSSQEESDFLSKKILSELWLILQVKH